jgi:hypothetical protein
MQGTKSTAIAIVILAGVLPVWAQESAPGAWRRFGDPAPNGQQQQPQGDQQAPPAQPQQPGFNPDNAAIPQAAYAREPQGPVTLTVPPGTWVTVRVNGVLSSDHSQPGDAFMATLAEPIVVNGRVVAHRGQTVSGRVVEALKAGRVKGTSSLHLELTELAVADGQQVPIKTQMIQRNGSTSVGRDVAAVGTTTALGAAVGAGAAGGFGAGMGAIGGAVVSGIGVLVTRGRPTVVYPEMALTFRLENPVTVTGDSYAFVPAEQGDFHGGGGPAPRYGYGAGAPRPYAPGPYGYAPYPYPYAYYPRPYYYGPGVYFGFGRGWGRRW